jgi:Aminotransferase class I and II
LGISLACWDYFSAAQAVRGEFLYSIPGYLALIDAAAHVGGIGVPVRLNAQIQNDLAALKSKVNAKTRAIYLINPHNPTGTISDDEAFQSFRKAVFISYRGKLSPFVVRSIFGNLTNHGYDVFMDVERIDSGNFETIGMDAIAGRSLWRASAPSAP